MVTKPIIVRTADGQVLDLVRTDEKGFKKSLEHGRLWVRHGETERLLPYHGPDAPLSVENDNDPAAGSFEDAAAGVFESLVEKEGWFEAIVPEADGEARTHHTAGPRNGAGDGGSGTGGEQSTAAGSTEAPAARRADKEPAADVLARLERIIAKRKADLPAGSYTTYLFQQGLAKIRKKTGEEAVELVLAADAGETVSESADFLYHLLVLLAALDIPFSEVLGELNRRFEK